MGNAPSTFADGTPLPTKQEMREAEDACASCADPCDTLEYPSHIEMRIHRDYVLHESGKLHRWHVIVHSGVPASKWPRDIGKEPGYVKDVLDATKALAAATKTNDDAEGVKFGSGKDKDKGLPVKFGVSLIPAQPESGCNPEEATDITIFPEFVRYRDVPRDQIAPLLEYHTTVVAPRHQAWKRYEQTLPQTAGATIVAHNQNKGQKEDNNDDNGGGDPGAESSNQTDCGTDPGQDATPATILVPAPAPAIASAPPTAAIAVCFAGNPEPTPFLLAEDQQRELDALIEQMSPETLAQQRHGQSRLFWESDRLLHKIGAPNGVPVPVDVSQHTVILLCGHTIRDKRCGVTAPILRAQIENVMESKHPEKTDQIMVDLVSHVGGHKVAGNMLIFSRQHGFVFYGRVFPKHIENILDKTVFGGQILDPLARARHNDLW